jgi:hypothetical protein
MFPLAGRSKAVEVEQRCAIQNGVADLDHAAKANEILIVDFVVVEQVGVVAEVPQKPSELPQGFGRAIDSASKSLALDLLRFKDTEAQKVKGFLRMPTVLGSLHADEEQSIGDVACCRPICLM